MRTQEFCVRAEGYLLFAGSASWSETTVLVGCREPGGIQMHMHMV